MSNSGSSQATAEVESSVYLTAMEREVLHNNYKYICHMLNVEAKDGIPIQKLRASQILPSFILRGFLAPLRDPQDLSKHLVQDKPKQTFDYASFLLAACRVSRSTGAGQVAYYFDMADLTGRTLYDWVAQLVVLALEAWVRSARRKGRVRQSLSPEEYTNHERQLVHYILLAPLYTRERRLDSFDPADETYQNHQFAIREWLKRCSTPGDIDLPAFRQWVTNNLPLRQIAELAFERTLFTPLDPTMPILPYPESVAAQRIVANLLSPRQVGRSRLLTTGEQWALCEALPTTCREQWDLVFASDYDGKSWNTFVDRLMRSGATLIVIREKGSNYIFGGFASEDWSMCPDFYGNSANFLFTIQPELRTYPSSRINDHYQYLNQGTQTLPNGLGMGGQLGYCGLWINPDFETGSSLAGPRCSTYTSPQLSKEAHFAIDSVEVWQVRRSPTESDDDDGEALTNGRGRRPKKSAMDAHPDAVALLEMANRKMYASTVRDPDLDLDTPGLERRSSDHEDDMEAILKRRHLNSPPPQYM